MLQCLYCYSRMSECFSFSSSLFLPVFKTQPSVKSRYSSIVSTGAYNSDHESEVMYFAPVFKNKKGTV